MQVSHHVGSAEDAAARTWALSLFELNPLRIALIYLVLGFGALYFSDVLLVRYVSDPVLGQLQAVKGGVEVLLTGGLIYVLTVTKEVQVNVTKREYERQREELLVLHRVLRHNLRNDLNVVFGHSRTLVETLGDETQRNRCEVIHRKAEEILHYTEQAERIRRVSEGDGTLTVVDLASRIPEIVENHPLVTEDVEVVYDLPESAPARVNRMFSEAVEEVVANAVENTQEVGSSIQITVDEDSGSLHQVELRIEDNGPGIPSHVPEILSESEYDQLAHLQGMGIWFVYWVVVESQGELFIERSPMGGASVVMRFPRADLPKAREAVPMAGRALPA